MKSLFVSCFLAIATLALWPAGSAMAQSCSASATQLAFGPVDVLSGAPADSAGSLTISCSGQAGRTVRVCANLGGPSVAGRRAMTSPSTSSSLLFDVFADSARTQTWGSFAADGSGVEIDLTLDASGNGSQARSMYGAIYGQQQTTGAGAYSATFQGGDSGIVYAYDSGLDCTVLAGSQSPISFQATANVSPSCNLQTSALDFGTVTLINGAVDAQTTLSVQCTAGIPYTVALNGGQANATDPSARQMTSGSATIVYGLYQDSMRSQGWGDAAGVNTLAGTGTAAYQPFPIYGRVPPQPTVPPGNYADTIIVSVAF